MGGKRVSDGFETGVKCSAQRGRPAPLGKQMGPQEEIAARQEKQFLGRDTRSSLFSHKHPRNDHNDGCFLKPYFALFARIISFELRKRKGLVLRQDWWKQFAMNTL